MILSTGILADGEGGHRSWIAAVRGFRGRYTRAASSGRVDLAFRSRRQRFGAASGRDEARGWHVGRAAGLHIGSAKALIKLL